MPKPLSEHSTSIKVQGERREGRMEPVGGGHVRRVEFHEEAEPEPQRAPEPKPVPREHRDNLDHIHFEIDNLDRVRRGAPRRERRTERRESKRVYDSPRGGVESAEHEDRRVLYTRKRVGNREEEQRFHSGLVDRIIAERYKGGPQFEEADAPKRGFLGRRKARAPTPEPEPAKESEYQPQCAAVTRDGVQCRNSTKDGSEYCGSHQSYSPRSVDDVIERSAEQCQAYTKDGDQCKRGPRSGSKYCSVHKGYRAPSRAQLEKQMDTLPRHAGAEDTQPRFK